MYKVYQYLPGGAGLESYTNPPGYLIMVLEQG